MKIKGSIPYKHTCSICGEIFLSKFRSHNICSKTCRNSIKKNKKKYRKCIICGWNATIDTHHEGGEEYNLCPNHHSLLTRGRQNLTELLSGVIYYTPRIKNQKYVSSILFNNFYNDIEKSHLQEFRYKDIIALLGWKLCKVKKYVLKLIKLNKIEYIKKVKGGKNQPAIFTLR